MGELLHRIWYERALPLLGLAAALEIINGLTNPPIDGTTAGSVGIGLFLLATIARRNRPPWYVLTILNALAIAVALAAGLVTLITDDAPFGLELSPYAILLSAAEILLLLSPAVRRRARVIHTPDELPTAAS